MDNSLAILFNKTLSRSGFEVQEQNDKVLFEKRFIRGEVTLKKPFTVTWKIKNGYNVISLPRANGNSSVQFNKVGDVLNFLERYLL